MIKSLMILFVSLTFIACAGDEDSTKDKKKGGFDEIDGSNPDALEGSINGNNSKPSSCGDSTPLGLSLQSNKWVYRFQHDNIQIEQVLQFSETGMTNTVACSYFGDSVQAQVHSQVKISAFTGSVNILNSVMDSTTLETSAGSFRCSASLRPEHSFAYTFTGKCLAVGTNAGILHFLPKN